MSDIAMILKRIGGKLVSEVAPKLEGDYSGGQAGMAGMLSVMAGDMFDKQADLLVNEIAGLRVLLEAGGRASDLTAAASFRISDLKARRNSLAEQLINLQTSLEGRNDEEAKTLNAKIWGHLLATSAARMPSPPQFAEEADD